MNAVIDRFEGEDAVILLESGEVVHVPRHRLPKEASEGSHVTVLFDANQTLQSIQLDQQSTETARQRIQEKLERLRRNEHLNED